MRFLPNGLTITRLGISISKKTCPNATERNKLKRLIREVFRKNKAALPKGYDILIKPIRVDRTLLGYNMIEKAVFELFKNAEVLAK